jgi:cytochrome P450
LKPFEDFCFKNVFSEIRSFGRKQLTAADVAKMRYFRSCQQESFRLMPTNLASLRIMPQDMVLRGYHVPAGTVVMWNNMLLGKDRELWGNPGEPGWQTLEPNYDHYVYVQLHTTLPLKQAGLFKATTPFPGGIRSHDP